jgi:hypothetical protein
MRASSSWYQSADNAREVFDAFAKLVSSVQRKEHRHKFGAVKDAFSGKAATQTLHLNGAPNATKQSVAALGNQMLALNLMRHCTHGERGFEDSAVAFYAPSLFGHKMLLSGGEEPLPLFTLANRDKELLVEVCRQMLQDLDVRDRTPLIRTFRSSFVGIDAVDWISANTDRRQRQEAVKVLTEMLRAGEGKFVVLPFLRRY